MDPITPPEIPASYAAFARAMADLAAQHKMKECTLTFRPEFGQATAKMVGKVKFHFAGVDGRGRPSRKLSVVLKNAVVTLTLENEPDSFS